MYGQAVKCDQCERVEFSEQTFDRGMPSLEMPVGWFKVQGFDPGQVPWVFCSWSCIMNFSVDCIDVQIPIVAERRCACGEVTLVGDGRVELAGISHGRTPCHYVIGDDAPEEEPPPALFQSILDMTTEQLQRAAANDPHGYAAFTASRWAEGDLYATLTEIDANDARPEAVMNFPPNLGSATTRQLLKELRARLGNTVWTSDFYGRLSDECHLALTGGLSDEVLDHRTEG
jgi:hypothetical protein